MTIYNGCDGSLNLYYKGLLISSFALTKNKTFEGYKYQGEYLILSCLKQNLNLKDIIRTLTYFCDTIYNRKKNKQPIRRTDHQMFLSSLFGLLKLNSIDNDESNGYLIMPKKEI